MVRRDEALRPHPARAQGCRAAAATTTSCRSEFRKRLTRQSQHRLRHHRLAFALAGLPGELVARTRSSRSCGCRSHPGFRDHPRAGRAACRRRLSTGGRTVKVPGAARVERQSVRYAARAQPLDWLSDRHDHMSTVPVSIDLPPTPRAPWATRRVLRSVPGGWGSATSELDALRRPPTSSPPRSSTPPLSTLAGRPRPVSVWWRPRRGAPDRGRRRPPVPEAAPTRASSRSSPTGAPWSTTTSTTTRPATGTPTGWCQLRIGRVRMVCGTGECPTG